MPWNSEGLEDFSAARLLPAAYSGSDEKYTVQMDGAWWMLKFGSALPPDKSKPLLGSYNNAPISEHIACQVANLIGIKAQGTSSGTRTFHPSLSSFRSSKTALRARLWQTEKRQSMGSRCESSRAAPSLSQSETRQSRGSGRRSASMRLWATMTVTPVTGDTSQTDRENRLGGDLETRLVYSSSFGDLQAVHLLGDRTEEVAFA